jgi:hypothetical protein
MSEVEVNEHIDNEIPEQAPAEELVDLILTGELHAANQKFNSIVEGKVIDAIEEEKHKISQTLFADDEEEVDEGKIPPQFLKGKDKDDDDDDDDSDDDDSDSDDDDDDEDDDKPKKGKVPPQFAKAEEGITGDPEANERAIAKNRAMAKKYGQVRQGIPPEKKEAVEAHIIEDLGRDIESGFKKLSSKKAKAGKSAGFEGNTITCGDFKITPVKYHDASDTTPGADESHDFHVYVEDGAGKAVTSKIPGGQGGDAIHFDTEDGKFSSGDKKTAKGIEKWCKSTSEAIQAVYELSSDLTSRAADKAYNDIRDNPSSQKATLGTTKTAKSDAKRKRQTDKFQTYTDRKDYPEKGDTKSSAAKDAASMGQKRKGKPGGKSDQQRHTDWRDNPADKEQGYHTSSYDPTQSFDPGEASANVELPEDSFVQQVADNLAGKRR